MTTIILSIFAALWANTAQPCTYEDGSEMLEGASYSSCKWDGGDNSFVVVKTSEGGAVYLTYYYEDGTIER